MEGNEAGPVERLFERALFATRWLLAPLYVALAACFGLIYYVFAQKALQIVAAAGDSDASAMVLAILSLIDLVLMGNLLLLVIFAGYESFVSQIDARGQRLVWMGRVGFGNLKLRLIASIVAISTIHLLEDFMHVSSLSDRDEMWRLALHGVFLVSGLLLALMDRMVETSEAHDNREKPRALPTE